MYDINRYMKEFFDGKNKPDHNAPKSRPRYRPIVLLVVFVLGVAGVVALLYLISKQ